MITTHHYTIHYTTPDSKVLPFIIPFGAQGWPSGLRTWLWTSICCTAPWAVSLRLFDNNWTQAWSIASTLFHNLVDLFDRFCCCLLIEFAIECWPNFGLIKIPFQNGWKTVDWRSVYCPAVSEAKNTLQSDYNGVPSLSPTSPLSLLSTCVSSSYPCVISIGPNQAILQQPTSYSVVVSWR